LARLNLQREPEPLPVRFLSDEAPQLIGFRFSPVKDHCGGAGDWLDIEMIGSGGEAFVHKV
jgi:hypothetical protein